MEYLLKHGQVFTQGRFQNVDILLRDGRIAAVGGPISSGGSVSIDLGGAFIFPGLVDVHVHLREPGFSYKETIAAATLAAARGGYAHLGAMPNLNPVPDSRAHLQAELEAIARDAKVHVHPYGAITVGEQGEELADLAAMAPDVLGFSDDGKGVQDSKMMERAMCLARDLGKPIVAHCEDNTLLRGGYIHDGEYARLHGHRGICSESEWGQIARDLELVKKTGCRYHVCHVSAKESVDLIRRAKAEGVDVTCETGPHYLLMNDMDLQEDGRFKMNPPIRSEADREALVEGILDGTIDMIITDHAPHSAEEKSRGLEKSLMGVVGLECAFAVLYTGLVKKGILSLEKLLDLMHTAPARRFGVGTPIAVGQPADLTVFDLEKKWTVDPEQFLSLGRATPFEGWEVQGACKMTFIGGEIAWQEDET